MFVHLIYSYEAVHLQLRGSAFTATRQCIYSYEAVQFLAGLRQCQLHTTSNQGLCEVKKSICACEGHHSACSLNIHTRGVTLLCRWQRNSFKVKCTARKAAFYPEFPVAGK